MKKAVLWAMTLLLVMTGCQSTPEQPVVRQKDLAQMIEKGMAASDRRPTEQKIEGYSARCAFFGVPEHYQTVINKQGVEIHADVAIELPEVAALPMARVEAAKFSQEQVYALFHALCGDTQMYVVPPVWNKAYYEQQILKWQARIADETDETLIGFYHGFIDDLKNKYEAAPETVDIVLSDGTLQTRYITHANTDAASGTQTYLAASSDPRNEQGGTMHFDVSNDIDYANTEIYSYKDESGDGIYVIAPRSGSQMDFNRDNDDVQYGRQGTALADVTALSLSGSAAGGCLMRTTPRQARDTVEQLVANAGLGDMIIDRVNLYSNKEAPPSPESIAYLEQHGYDTPDPDSDEPETQAYVFRLLRQVNGVKVESTHGDSETCVDAEAFGKEWAFEALTVAVDDQGIVNLFWTGPLNVTQMLTMNTTILPWGDIEGVFEKMLPIKYTGYTKTYNVRIDMTRISLSLQRMTEQDSFTTGLLVPVWNFYGMITLTDEQGNKRVSDADMAYIPLLCVNAIDGSVINPIQGY